MSNVVMIISNSTPNPIPVKRQRGLGIRIGVPRPRKADPENYTFEEVYKEYHEWLVRRLYNYGESNVESQDMAQDVMFRIMRYWPKADTTRIDALIARVAKNVVCDYLDMKYRRPVMIQFDPILDIDEEGFDEVPDTGYIDTKACDPYREMLNQRDFEKVMAITELFSPVQKRVFDLHFVQSMTPPDIADEMGVNGNVVYSALYAISRIVNELCDKPETEAELTWNMS
ncbi:MAG: RNA polymerase sigma factor [Bacteroidales bacterium]